MAKGTTLIYTEEKTKHYGIIDNIFNMGCRWWCLYWKHITMAYHDGGRKVGDGTAGKRRTAPWHHSHSFQQQYLVNMHKIDRPLLDRPLFLCPDVPRPSKTWSRTCTADTDGVVVSKRWSCPWMVSESGRWRRGDHVSGERECGGVGMRRTACMLTGWQWASQWKSRNGTEKKKTVHPH